MHMVSCRHAVVPRLNETSVSQRASEKWGEKREGGKRWRTSGSRGAGGGETRIYARPSNAALPIPCPLSLQKYCNTRDICRPREEKGIKRSLKTPNLSFKEGALGVVDVVGAIETRGAFAFLFAGLKIVPFYGDGGG